MHPRQQGSDLRGVIKLLLSDELHGELKIEFSRWKQMGFAEFAKYFINDTLSFHHFAFAFVAVLVFAPGCLPLH